MSFLKKQLPQKLKLAVTGALGGAVGGFFGAGGGLIIVPLFIAWCGLEEKKALATTVSVILPLSLVSLFIYGFAGELDFQVALPYCIGGFAGGIIAGLTMGKISASALRRIFGLLLLYSGVRMFF